MDKYVRVKEIGEGSFGKALLVRSKANGKQMVIKEINMKKMSRKERDEARKEVAVLAQLHHPNIVSYRESFEEIGNLYIAMDYCDGGDLYGRINKQRGLLFTEDQVLDWFVQTCLAIKHIHDRKILHRDVKSQNIFLTKHGIVKLGDFGIAKVLNSTVELARTCIGTPYYLSPEICENKPYNNKSDIWSLGCVLYELSTLKHAFEAGNMKNLVLKIIRGSYPPPPPRYTYELRNLIALLFKRSPRDRPSINTVLRKPLLQSRIRKFLSENEVADEFSHTVMHGVKIKKQVPSGDARPLPPKPQLVNKAPTPVPKYNPASVYAPSVARKAPSNRKSSEVRKSGGDVKRPTPSPANHMNDLARRRQELIDRERKRRDDAKKKLQEQQQQQAYAKRHQELVDKQKQARFNKAREDGWKGMMDSLSSEDSDKRSTSKSVNSEKSKTLEKKGNKAKKKSGPSPRQDPVSKAATPKPAPAPSKDRGNYDNYHNYLDKLNADRQAKIAASAKPSPTPHVAQLGVAGALGGGAVYAARQGAAAGARGAEAASRARVVGDYMQRKQQAAVNRARAHGDLFGGAAAAVSPRVSPSVAKTPTPTPSAGRPESARDSRDPVIHKPRAGDKDEQDYLSRLRQIRLQNFNERRNIKDQISGKADPKYKPSVDPRNDPDARKKKIEALKAQADERAKKLRGELEKKRREAYELEQQRLKNQGRAPDRAFRPSAAPKPAAPIPMTEAMKAIGVVRKEPPQPASKLEKCPIGMTAAMEAIGAGPQAEPDTAKVDRQKQKEAILKRLNAKPPVPEKSERPKWGPPAKPAVSERPKWGAADEASALRAKSLEETGSQMDATSAGDGVVKHLPYNAGEAEVVKETEDSQPSARKHWGGPAGTVLNLLEHADISENSTFKSDSSEGSTSQPPPSNQVIKTPDPVPVGGQAPAIGTTITITKAPGKGTVIIKKADQQPEQSASAVKSGDVKAQDERSRSPDPNVKADEDTKIVQATEKPNEHGEKPRLFDRVELDEDEPRTKVGESLVVEDLDVREEDSGDVTSEKEVTEGSQDVEETPSPSDKTVKEKKLSSSQKVSSLKDPALVLGLTTGNFDTDVQMLRTCSEPDLAKLFRTIQQENPVCAVEMSLNISSLEDALLEAEMEEEENQAVLREAADDIQQDDDDDGQEEDAEEDEATELTEATRGLETYVPDFGDIDENAEEGKDEDEAQEEEEDDEDGEEEEEEEAQEEEVAQADTDDEDIKTMRESMMSLLQTEDTTEDEPLHTATKKKLKKSSKKGKKSKKKKVKDGLEQSAPRSRRWADSSMEDLQSMKETMKTLLNPEPVKSPKHSTLKSIKEVDGTGDAATKQPVPMILPECESWQSDEDEDDDDYFEEEDMFSRLEASRAKLEQELGCETFLKAYKTVQAIHEDEDENMEEGVHLVSSILGHDNIHLYPSILQLVMADGVFTEDND